MQALSAGELLWDVFPDRELLGGAPLNFSANLARMGNTAALITAVGQDERGRLALEAMASLRVDTQFVRVVAGVPTGVAMVSMTAEGEPRFDIPRPAAFDRAELSDQALERARALRPDWLYFGTLTQMEPRVEQIIRRLHEALPEARCFYDMNLRPGAWSLDLVQRLSGMASILKLNEFEARTLGEQTGMGPETFSLERFCKHWAARYAIESICVTLGAAGCLVYRGGVSETVPGYPSTVADTVGAGDAFAAAFLHGYQHRWAMLSTARFANAVGSVVASRAGATPAWSMEECLRLAGISLEQAESSAGQG